MLTLAECIQHNLNPRYNVLSDHVFYKAGRPLLGPPIVRYYRPKTIRTDHDGVWEEKKQLCIEIKDQLIEENKELKQNRGILDEIYHEPDVEIQEKMFNDILVQCHVKWTEVLNANRRAVKKFQWVKNASSAITALRRYGYRWEVYSGSFARLIVESKPTPKEYPLALKRVWKGMGVPEDQINGSEIYCNKEGYVESVRLMLRSRKRSEENTFIYYIVLTNDLFSDSAMMECSLDILPIALIVEKSKLAEIRHGLTLPFPEMKKDAKNLLNTVLKIERGLVQYLGMTEEEIRRCAEIAKEVSRFANLCSNVDDSLFPLYKDLYVDATLGYLDSQKIRIGDRLFSLFPESPRRVRGKVNLLRTEKIRAREEVKETFDILREYSPDFKT